MKIKPVATLALFAGALLPAGAYACAGCRNPNMPVTRMETVLLRPGELRAGFSLGLTGIEVGHEAGCADLAGCSEQPVQPLYMHNQDIYPGEARAIGELGLTAALGVEAQVPVRLVRTSIAYTDPAGRPYAPVDPGTHHRDETLIGFGDPWLLLRWAGGLGRMLVSFRAGASVPIGRTEPNPFELGDRGQEHQHIQFGSGTVDPILALDISRPMGRWMLSGHALGQAAFYDNGHGFRAGTRVSGGVQAGRRIWRSLTGALGLEAMREGPERWDGDIQQEGNLGRTEALAALSLVQPFRAAALGVSARIPVYRHIEAGDEPPGTFSSPVMLGFFASRTFRPL